MEFGRVSDLSNLDVTLPADHPRTAKVLASGAGGGRSRIRVGCPLWNDPALARKISPAGAAASDRLVHYAHGFNAIELNASGYGLDAGAAARWSQAVGKGFLFCPKVPMEISHSRNLEDTGPAYAGFLAAARAFGDHLGPAFLQFPDSFGPSRFPELSAFLRAQAGKIPLAVELRHAAWFNDARRIDPLFALFEELKIIAVITDAPGRRDILHQRLSVPSAFIRFSGHDMSPKDLHRLDDWAERLKAWLDAGLESLFFFLHHEPKHFSVDWSVRFLEVLNKVCGVDLPVPQIMEPAKSKKKAPEGIRGQGDLFA
jgi:uncharacterized protein YecE (DUF72 family)